MPSAIPNLRVPIEVGIGGKQLAGSPLKPEAQRSLEGNLDVFVGPFVDGKIVVEFLKGIVDAVVGSIQQSVLKSAPMKNPLLRK